MNAGEYRIGVDTRDATLLIYAGPGTWTPKEAMDFGLALIRQAQQVGVVISNPEHMEIER